MWRGRGSRGHLINAPPPPITTTAPNPHPAPPVPPPATPPVGARRGRPGAPAALLGAVAVLAYWPAVNGGFVWDDDTLLTTSELVRAPDGLYRFWFTTEPLDYWPMTNSSFWLEWRL